MDDTGKVTCSASGNLLKSASGQESSTFFGKLILKYFLIYLFIYIEVSLIYNILVLTVQHSVSKFL